MDQIFTRNLIDCVKQSRMINQSDLLTYYAQLSTEIKSDLKGNNDQSKQQALLKLFFLSMEGYNIKWAEFNVINSMGSSQYLTKRYSFLAAHLVIDDQSQGLIMLTNLFKKELQNSNNIIECSEALSCVGTICNKDLGEAIITQIINLCSHTKPLLRKKALAVLAKIMNICPHLIPGNIDKVMTRLSSDESNPTVLACAVNLISQVLKVAPSIFPLFIKFIYEQLQKQKSNWLLIKLVRISNRIIQLEPRFQKKLIEPFTRLLNQTHSKSLQYELIHNILKNFRDQQQLFDGSIDILKTFIDHQDPNIRSLGLECLTQMLEYNPSALNSFFHQLSTSFTFGDYFHKVQILQLFKDYTSSNNYNDVVGFYIKDLQREQDQQIKSKIIDTILVVSHKNKFQNIDDPEYFFLEYVPILAIRIESQDNAIKLRDILFDLLSRIPELYYSANILYMNILDGFIKQQSNGIDLETIDVMNSRSIKYETTARETLFKALLMIASEATRVLDQQGLVKQIVYISQLSKVNQFDNSMAEMHSLIFKQMVQFCRGIQDKDEDFIKDLLKDQIQTEVTLITALAWIIQNYLIVCKNIHQRENISSLNPYQKLIITTLDSFNNKFTELYVQSLDTIEINIIELIDNPKNWVDGISSLNIYFLKELPPIPLDSQKLIRVPDNLDLDTPISLDMSEVLMIKQINDQQQQSQNEIQIVDNKQQLEQQVQQNPFLSPSLSSSLSCSVSPSQNDLMKPKKVLKVMKDEVLPPGITQNDIQNLYDDD